MIRPQRIPETGSKIIIGSGKRKGKVIQIPVVETNRSSRNLLNERFNRHLQNLENLWDKAHTFEQVKEAIINIIVDELRPLAEENATLREKNPPVKPILHKETPDEEPTPEIKKTEKKASIVKQEKKEPEDNNVTNPLGNPKETSDKINDDEEDEKNPEVKKIENVPSADEDTEQNIKKNPEPVEPEDILMLEPTEEKPPGDSQGTKKLRLRRVNISNQAQDDTPNQ